MLSIKELPDQFSTEKLFERIILLQKVELGIEQSKSGQVLTTQQAKEKLKRNANLRISRFED